jgi:hypothetical protein
MTQKTDYAFDIFLDSKTAALKNIRKECRFLIGTTLIELIYHPERNN